MRAKMMNWTCSRGCCGTAIYGRKVRSKEKRDWKAYEQAAEHKQPKRGHSKRW